MQSGQAIADRWLVRLLSTYPSQVARFMSLESDPMLNPVGQRYRQSLGVLVVELLGGMNWGRARKALDALMQVRAVSGSPPSESIAFMLDLKEILREDLSGPMLASLEERVDKLLLAAFDLYVEHRERMYEAQKNDAQRRWSVLERVLAHSDHSEHAGLCERGVS